MFKLNQIDHRSKSGTSSPILYESFTFVDNITKNSIKVKDFQNRFSQNFTLKQDKTNRSTKYQQTKELETCMNFLKQTTIFRKNALKHKLFGNSCDQNYFEQEKQSWHKAMIKKKRTIRKVLQNEINQINKKELDTYLKNPSHHPSQTVFKMNHFKVNSINKSQVAKIIQTLQHKYDAPSYKKMPKTRQNIEKDAFLDRINLLQSQIQGQIQEKLRKQGQFLVHPEFKNVNITTNNIKSKKQLYRQHILSKNNLDCTQFKWKVEDNSHKLQKIRRPLKIKRKMSKDEKDVLDMIANKQIIDMQIFVKQNGKQSLKVCDQRGNTLLHLAVIYSKTLIFEWLIRILNISCLLIKNEQGLTPIDLAINLDKRQILSYIPNSLL